MPGKTELINQVAERTGMTKSQVQKVFEEMLSEIRSSLEKGEDVIIRGFGTFKVTERSPRKGRNPRTGEEIEIPGGKRVTFRMSK
ncbi:histone family protein DNA-binding protein [Thermobaculum terrenum ATCC BAA-798]|uniref:Histone family protein DNA-binding protein n=1 Tax=Thermobaculum terrenum (strain ATCC BAA-798 / CCMEE 7001 / YNP1) TaxID=525904 RepID=D1CFB6_THET1|nr:HU family DNA-binding protein [Thermobaculum terrenum]ACZ41622.1 histone family protein DNA-binding protein [Thermobaculum terrenum ATCC BAA-798]